jgi:hypothetical protein
MVTCLTYFIHFMLILAHGYLLACYRVIVSLCGFNLIL